MVLKQSEVINSLLVTVSATLLFIGISFHIEAYTNKYAFFLGVFGVILYLMKDRLVARFRRKFSGFLETIATLVIQTLAYVCLFLAVQYYLKLYVDGLATYYMIFGIILYTYHSKITQFIVGGSSP